MGGERDAGGGHGASCGGHSVWLKAVPVPSRWAWLFDARTLSDPSGRMDRATLVVNWIYGGGCDEISDGMVGA